MRYALALFLLLIAVPANAATYAMVSGGAVVEVRDFASPPPDMTRKGFQWLPVVVTDPAFDPATQVRTGPVITVEAARVTRVWTVRAKTAQELDDDKTARIEGQDLAYLLAICNQENRIRVLEARSQITLAQCKTGLKALLP